MINNTMKFKYLFFIILSCLVVGYVVFSWSEPITPMPSGYTAPLNTSATAQNKVGELGAASFVDADDSDYYINPSGNSVVSGKIVMEDSTTSSDPGGTVATKIYVDTEISRIEALTTSSLPLVGGMHVRSECTSIADSSGYGEVVDSDVALPLCRFDLASCPSGWAPYKGFTTTTTKTCGTCTTCTAAGHAWGDLGQACVRECRKCYWNSPYCSGSECVAACCTACNSWCLSGSGTMYGLTDCTATINQIGCY